MNAIGFLLGCWALMQFSRLPSPCLLLVVGLLTLFSANLCSEYRFSLPSVGQFRWKSLVTILGCCFLGLFWQAWHAQSLFENRLKVDYEGQELRVQGIIADIPHCDEQHCSFSFLASEGLGKQQGAPMVLQLSWYGLNRPLHAGERWQLAVRLKRIRATLNPGAFDVEAWSWQHHIGARGTVNQHGENRYIGEVSGYGLVKWRERLLKSCQELLRDQAFAGVITALNLGWTQDIPYAHKLIVQRTGTAHLLAISGLHVGMVAGLLAWLMSWAWKLIPRLSTTIPAPTLGAFGAIAMAFIYSEMSGFACSTQRACVMCTMLVLPKILHRHMTVKTALFRALWVVLIWDPCVVLSSGFWLSFMAVFVLVFAQYSRDLPRWLQHLETQWICLIGLLPLSCWYFHQISLVSILANLIAIPLVGFVILPLVLMGTALVTIYPPWAQFIFFLAMKIIAALGYGLAYLSQLHWAVWSYNFAQSWELFVVTLGCAMLVFTQKKWRWLGILGLIPLTLPSLFPLPKGEFKLNVLDVGQGLATIISTAHHTLIFDTGAKFSDQMDCGQQILIPYLIQEKIKVIDVLVVSHADNDHAGGAKAISDQWPVKKFYTSAVERLESISPANYCLAGEHWEWDGVKFEFLYPSIQQLNDAQIKGNDRSCVLKVSNQFGSVLLVGDIEKKAEQWLCEHQQEKLKSEVLIVPHHGSKSSSTLEFLASVNPTVAVLSYGYKNRYHHPHLSIVRRYLSKGIQLISTMRSGALVHRIGPIRSWQFYRDQHQEFWRNPV